MRTDEFEFNGYHATVIVPDNPNGKWIWKTEFLYAFDAAERELVEKHGYTRVYYSVSDMYGSQRAIRLMHRFHLYVIEKYNLEKKGTLLGFSRGGLYTFNYAITYPELVDKVYLDAPVLDLKSWPVAAKWPVETQQMYDEYFITAETLPNFRGNPVDLLDEYFSLNIPTLVVAGDADTVVPLKDNAAVMIAYCREHNIELPAYIKPGCGHHPHSLEDNVAPIIDFITK